jgi:hypothetical protein
MDFIILLAKSNSRVMRNFKHMVEAAYLLSKRQGNMMRDRERERSPHEDRRNRYVENEMQPGTDRHGGNTAPRQTMDRRQPAGDYQANALKADHRGKGPRNYKRSDERIQELVCDLLCDCPDLDASSIDVSVKDSEVILSGEVNEKYEKRLAEDLAENVVAVSNVENRIRVNRRQMV